MLIDNWEFSHIFFLSFFGEKFCFFLPSLWDGLSNGIYFINWIYGIEYLFMLDAFTLITSSKTSFGLMIKVNRVLDGMFVCWKLQRYYLYLLMLYGERWEDFQLSTALKVLTVNIWSIRSTPKKNKKFPRSSSRHHFLKIGHAVKVHDWDAGGNLSLVFFRWKRSN